MISERSFRADNQLTDPFADGPEMVGHHGQMAWIGPQAPPDDATVGDTVLVNGRAAPYLQVSRHALPPAAAQLLAVLELQPDALRRAAHPPDRHGQRAAPEGGGAHAACCSGPAQRADVIVDFSGATGRRLVLESVPAATGYSGDDARETAVMEFRVGDRAPDPSRLPSRLPSPALVSPVPTTVSKTWTFGLGGDDHHGSFWSINGRAFDPARVDHRARLGTVERWRFRNTSDVTHYVHIHAEQWRTLLRDGKRATAVGAGARGHLAPRAGRGGRGGGPVHRLHRRRS